MKIKKDYIWSGIVAILVVALIVVVVANPVHSSVSPKKAGEIAQQLFSSAYPGVQFSVIQVSDMGNFYDVTLNANLNGKSQQLTMSITKDGKYIGQMRSISELMNQMSQVNSQQTKFAPPKKEVPEVKLFVMPFCPFGRPAENSLIQVYKLLGNKTKMEIHYIIDVKTADEIEQMAEQYKSTYNLTDEQVNKFINQTEQNSLKIQQNGTTYYVNSLHGPDEAKEAIRELCMWKYYPEKTWDYIWDMNHNCTSNLGTCENEKWMTIAQSLGMNTTKIENCYKDEGLSLVRNEMNLDNQYQASASPTLIVNGDVYKGMDRSANGYKDAICLGFSSEPSECQTNLSSGYKATGNC